jgi:FkbM family methyltransferase
MTLQRRLYVGSKAAARSPGALAEYLRWLATPPSRLLRVDGYAFADLHRPSTLFLLEEIWLEGCYDVAIDEPSPLIVDAGANIGVAALRFAHRHPGLRLVAFEPSPDAAAVLRRNLAAAHVDATVHELALGRTEGTFELLADRVGSVGATIATVAAPAAHVDTVSVVTLSSLLSEPVALLKLDAEGSEFAILGELETAGRLELVRRIVLECNLATRDSGAELAEALALLDRNGFEYRIAGWAPRDDRFDSGQDLLVYARSQGVHS